MIPEHSLFRTRPVFALSLTESVGLAVVLFGLYWPREYRVHLLVAMCVVAASLGIVNWWRERQNRNSDH
jgi:hypothetical protein